MTRTTGPTGALGTPLPATLAATAACTPTQRALWRALVEPVLPMSSPCRLLWLDLTGPLDRPALRSAVDRLVQRHDALRCVFDVDGACFQVLPSIEVELVELDLSAFDEAERGVRSDAIGRDVAQREFDLQHGPLLRARLLRLGGEQHRLLLGVHRLVCDGHGLHRLGTELGQLYSDPNVAPPGEPGSLLAEARDASITSRGHPDQPRWIAQLGGVAGRPLPLPPSRPSRVQRVLPTAAVKALDALALRLGGGREAGWLALFAALVGRQCRCADLLVACEAGADDRDGIGPGRGLLPLRLQMNADATLAALLRQAAAVLVEGRSRAAPDIDDLLQRLALPEGARWPLAPCLLRLRTTLPAPGFRGLETQLRQPDVDADDVALALTIHVDRPDDRVRAELAGRLPADQAAGWLAALEAALVAAVARPDAPLARVFAGPAAEGGLPAIAAPRSAPLSADQTRCWLQQLRHPEAARGNLGMAHRLHGPLDAGALQAAVADLVERQPVLRLQVIGDEQGRLRQRLLEVEPGRTAQLAALARPNDLSAVDEALCEATLQRRLEDELARPFRGGEPLLRLRLFRLADDRHVLLLAGHAVAVDEQSLELLAGELAERYAAHRGGDAVPVTPLPLGLIERALWHAEWTRGADYAAQCSAWRRRMQRLPTAPLPPDRPDDAPAAASARDHLHLPGWLVSALREVGSGAGHGLREVLLAAVALLLGRWAGSTVAMVGLPLSPRDREPLHELAGPLTTCLPACIPLAAELGFVELIASCAKAVAERERAPELQADDLLGGHGERPPYQAIFQYRDLRAQPSAWGDLAHEALPLEPVGSSDDFVIWLVEQNDGIAGALLFDPRRFEPATAALFRDQLVSLLASVATDPAQTVARLCRPAAFEQDRLRGWSVGPPTPEVRADSLTARLRRICATQPQAPAVLGNGQSLCFRQLSRAVANAAVHLRSRVAAGDLLALALPAGAERIAAMLAGLSVGARCLLLDPDASPARLEACLQAAADGERGRRRRWLVADGKASRAIRAGGLRRIDPRQLQQDADSRLELLRTPCSSRLLVPRTGADGGIELASIPERALLALDNGLREQRVFDTSTRMAVRATPDSARSLLECLLPLLAGGAIVFDLRARRLADWLEHEGVDTVIADARDWLLEFERGWRGRDGLTRIADGAPSRLPGEPDPEALLGRHFRAFGDAGAGVWALFGAAGGSARVLPARQVHVVDDSEQLAAIGVFGTLRLAAESHDGTAALAVTAGRARWRADGSLELAAPDHYPAAPASGARVPPASPPTTPLQALLHDLWSELLGHGRFGIDDSFWELGGKPQAAARLFQRTEQQIGVNLPQSTLYRAPTIRRLAATFAAAGSRVIDAERLPDALLAVRDAWRPLVPIRSGGAERPLFLVHGLGGNVMNYRVLARALPEAVPVYGLQAIGLDGRSAPLVTIEAMAARYLEEVRAHQPEGPYRLGGTSVGGAVAFEMARQLREQDQPVELLALLDAELPAGRERPAVDFRQWLWPRAGEPAELWSARARMLLAERLQWLADHARIATCALLRQPLPHGPRHRRLQRVHGRAWKRYRPGHYDGPITQFLASADGVDDPTLGWGRLAGASVTVIAVGGNHRGVVARASLAAALGAALCPLPVEGEPEPQR